MSAQTDDPFLWLEDIEGARSLDWVRAQNDRSLKELESHPLYDAFLRETRAILNAEDRLPHVALRGGHAYNFWQDSTHVRGVWRRMPIGSYLDGVDRWETILDIDTLAREEGENWVFGGSNTLRPDHRRSLLTLSRGGSDAAVIREFDIERRAFVKAGFAIPEAKSSVTWEDDNTLLVGTDTGKGSLTASGYPRMIRRWRRGSALRDAPVVFEGADADVTVSPFALWDGRALRTGIVRALTFYETETFLSDGAGGFRQLPFPPRADIAGMTAGRLLVLLREPWTRDGEALPEGALISFDPRTDMVEPVFLPEDRMAVDGVDTAPDVAFVSVLDNIAGRLLRLERNADGWTGAEVPLQKNAVVSLGTVDEETGLGLVSVENPTTPETLFSVDACGRKTQRRSAPAYFEGRGIETRQHEAISSDGTAIPYFVTGRTDVLDGGPAPVIQYGYGGFQVSILPHYAPTTGRLWLERGGLYVIANIRGGGEFGPAWHQAGLKTERQRIYDDFFAVSEDLIDRGLTTPGQLGILGGSNGGLLMGVALTQRPDLYAAVGIGVPLLDMLRFDRLLAGASWVGEFGSPSIAEEAAFLRQISPYHNLRVGAAYPRPFFFTSTKDDRVHPGHARKMAARMDDMGHEFLYYENIEGGHGAAANREQQAHRLALQFAYFAEALGLRAR